MDATESATLTRLLDQHAALAPALERHERYYQGTQRLEHLGLAVPPELRQFTVVVNWPRLVTDAVEERLDIEGFRLPDDPSADTELWRVWQRNDLDEQSQLAHQEALVHGRSYVCVGANEDDPSTPLVTVESPREMHAQTDPRTRRVTAAVRRYDPDPTGQSRRATLYLRDATLWLRRDGGSWVEDSRDDHRLGVVPVVMLVNRPRIGPPVGVPEMADVIGLTDAACRSLTNLQVAQETHAVPQRGVLGASQGDFVDADGQPLPAWQVYFGAVWAIESDTAKTFQFSPSDLRNFHETVNHYAKLVGALTGLPGRYLGFSSDNPASADAIRSEESRLVKRAERHQRSFGGRWEDVQRLVRRFQAGEEDRSLAGLETIWRDASTPTRAQAADAAVKLHQAGISTRRQAREDVGYTAAQIARMESDDAGSVERLLSDDLAGVLSGPPEPEPAVPVA